MMGSVWILVLAASVSPVLGQQESEGPKLEARVDARIELMSIIFRLSGAGEYNQPLAKSPYADEVDAHFGSHHNHPVVKMAKELRARCGVSFDAPMALAVHLTDTVSLGEKIPFDRAPPRLDKRWQVPDARDFLKKASDFVKETGFNQFFKDHRKLYRTAGKRMTAQLAKRDYVKWFDSYFGARPGARFYVIVGMLNGPCNYGSGIRYLDGTEEICPVIGAARFDDEGIPIFDNRIDSTVVHEFCHSYTNPIVEKHAQELESPARELFSHCEQVMSDQAYDDWKTMMKETFVRTSVVRHVLAIDGEAASEEEIAAQHGRGFKWVGEFSNVLAEYESKRERYKTFEQFMPKVIRFFNSYAPEYGRRLAREQADAPKVVRMIPPNGATDIDPNLTEIKVFFDRPMKDGYWAVVGGGPNFPESAGDVHYDKKRKIFTMPVRLKPNWSYHLWLNRGRDHSFQSQEGVKLESVEVTFKTRAG